VRLGRAISRGAGRGAGATRFRGIRFRLGLWLAIALLPLLILGGLQTEAAFRSQDADRRSDLQRAAERSAAAARARLDSTGILLLALMPEVPEMSCSPRLSALVSRVEDLDGVGQVTATGALVCASESLAAAPPAWLKQAGASAWFRRLRAGEGTVLARTPAVAGQPSQLIIAVRVERPMGRFDGAMVAVIPFSALQPDVADPALPSDAEAALTDGAGRILTASDPDVFKLSAGDDIAGWVDRARDQGSAVFEAKDAQNQRRDYAGAALAGGDLYALLSAPAPGWLSWARLNPIGTLLLPLGAWLTAFAAVMLLSERIFIRWLDYLERVAAIYAKGRFSVRPLQAMNAPSEIRTMARTLDEMAEAITVRDRELTDALAEKDALMREIHHRVKNN
ncbi:MAG: sensor histidine kinase, partial [Brevundimonas sp.]